MERRRAATQKTLERYRPKVFDWSKGVTCVHMARAHLRNMGHTLPAIPRFRSAMGAQKALRKSNWDSVEDMLDHFLPRIAPAQMLLGDLATVKGSDGFASILVCAGPFKLLGWHPETGEFVAYDGGNANVETAWRA